jgi:hypothetical protein
MLRLLFIITLVVTIVSYITLPWWVALVMTGLLLAVATCAYLPIYVKARRWRLAKSSEALKAVNAFWTNVVRIHEGVDIHNVSWFGVTLESVLQRLHAKTGGKVPDTGIFYSQPNFFGPCQTLKEAGRCSSVSFQGDALQRNLLPGQLRFSEDRLEFRDKPDGKWQVIWKRGDCLYHFAKACHSRVCQCGGTSEDHLPNKAQGGSRPRGEGQQGPSDSSIEETLDPRQQKPQGPVSQIDETLIRKPH